MNRILENEVNLLHAEICAGLADPKRILILYELKNQPRTGTDLANALRLPQPLVARHLKVLRDRGMLTATRIGPAVEYSIADERLIQALDLLRAVLHDVLAHRASLMNEVYPST